MVHPIPSLPPADDLETVPVFKALNQASRALATLKGQASSIPNQGILIDTLALQEAKVSSEIEKAQYYRLLQGVRDTGHWQDWIVFMLRAVAETSAVTLHLVDGIRQQMASLKHRMRAKLPKLYSQDLLNSLFRHPYTRIQYVQNEIKKTRQTASNYLKQLEEHGFVQKHSVGNKNYYINVGLVNLFMEIDCGTSVTCPLVLPPEEAVGP